MVLVSDSGAAIPDKASSSVRAIDRAVSILRCFDAQHPEMGISDIARRTGLSTTTTQRLLLAMQHNGLVRQGRASRRYRLGPLVLSLARSGALDDGLRDTAWPVMVALRDVADETVALHGYLPVGRRVVVDQAESRQELRRTYTDIGVPTPVVYGAPGKAILAALPDDERDTILAEPIVAVTPSTITDPDALRKQVVGARPRGFTESNAERTVGIATVAAPVFDVVGDVVGALSVSVPQPRMSDERFGELGERVRVAAWQISEGLGASAERVHARLPDLRLG